MRSLQTMVFTLFIPVVIIVGGGSFGVEGRQPVLHRVGGGRNTWAPNVNFTEWACHEHFYVGDWLYFGFDKHLYNVLEVNKTSYGNCIDTGFITNITRGGRDVFNLTEARYYYFISGRGYCFRGMKVAIYVTEETSPAPAPQVPATNISLAEGAALGWKMSVTMLVVASVALVLRRGDL